MVRLTIRNLQDKVFVSPRKIKEKIKEILKKEKVRGTVEINICFASDPLIRKINKKYLKKDFSTDVLAFDLTAPDKKSGLCADILVSVDTALRNAKTFKTTPAYELSLYSIHGLLHLLGYDDHSPADSKKMRAAEARLLLSLNK